MISKWLVTFFAVVDGQRAEAPLPAPQSADSIYVLESVCSPSQIIHGVQKQADIYMKEDCSHLNLGVMRELKSIRVSLRAHDSLTGTSSIGFSSISAGV